MNSKWIPSSLYETRHLIGFVIELHILAYYILEPSHIGSQQASKDRGEGGPETKSAAEDLGKAFLE